MTSAAFTQHLHPAQVAGQEMDGVMMFGFCVAVIALVFLLYQDDFKVKLPILPVIFGAAAVYGFLQGAWPLGLLLLGLTAREFATFRLGRRRNWHLPAFKRSLPRQIHDMEESRMSRMFGA